MCGGLLFSCTMSASSPDNSPDLHGRERRRQKRFRLLLKASLQIGGITYPGFIEDVSIEGMHYYASSFLNATGDFRPAKKLNLTFQAPSGITMELSCELIWFTRPTPADSDLSIGIKILDPPKIFREFVEALC